MALNARQQLFVAHYLIHKNATEAAKAAGYSEKSAQGHGSRLLSNAMIKEAVGEKIQTLTEKLGIGPDYILGRLKETAERCLQKQPVMEYDPISKEMVATGEWKFEHAGANKALELLGKYQKLFTDNIEFADKSDIGSKLARFKKHGK